MKYIKSIRSASDSTHDIRSKGILNTSCNQPIACTILYAIILGTNLHPYQGSSFQANN
jgi:hypothetical protein